MHKLITASGCAAFVLAFAVGCSHVNLTPSWLTVGPDYEKPETEISDKAQEAPDAGYPTTNVTATGEFAAASATEDPREEITDKHLVCWWMQFNDPVLTNVVVSAVSNNLTFLMARERLTQARWRYFGSAADLLPHLDFAGAALNKEAHRNNSSMVSSHKSTGTRASHSHYFNAGFDATWELDFFGGTRREMEEAGALVDSAEFSLEDAWVALTAEIGVQYITLRTVQERIAVAHTNLNLQSETYEILKSRLDSGIGDELAVNQAKYNVEQTRATIPGLLSTEESLKNALAILAGKMPGELHELLVPEPERDWLIAPQKLSAVPLDVVRSRPDVRAAERALAAQVAHVGVSTALLYPKFYLNGSLGLESVKVQKFLQPGSLYSSIGPSFSWPIFQGGNLIANLKMEESKMNEKILAYDRVMEIAVGEVRDAYSDYTQEYHRWQSLKRAVKAARDAENISQDLYKNGLADFNNVLDAQRSLLTLQEALTISRGLITTNLIKLYKALGGGLARPDAFADENEEEEEEEAEDEAEAEGEAENKAEEKKN